MAAATGNRSDEPRRTSAAADRLDDARRLGYLGTPDEAIEEYRRVLALSPTPRVAQEARMGIAALEYARGDYPRAREIVGRVLRQATDWDLIKLGTYRLKEIDRRIAWNATGGNRLAQCGVRSLQEVLRRRGVPVPVERVADLVEPAGGTASMAALRAAAGALGLDAVGARLTFEDLAAAPKPLIAHLHPNHFVVVTATESGGLSIVDQDRPERPLSERRFRELWSGLALLFPTADDPRDDLARLSEADMAAVRGGHHLHGNNLGDPGSNPASPFDGGPSPTSSCGGPGLPELLVNLSNFNLLVQDTDFVYGGLGPAVYLRRTYNADDPEEGVFGRSWSFNYGVVVDEQPGGSVNLRRESGKEEFFSLIGCPGGTCTYDPPIWIHDELIKHPDGTFELRLKWNRLIQRFDTAGRLTSVEDRNGNAVTLQYDAGGRLTTVTDATGRTTSFIYDANGKVSRVVDPANRDTTFSYDVAGNLIGSVDMAGNAIGYSYDENSYMESVTTPTGTWTITNVPYSEPSFGLVVESITDPLGHTTSYSTPGNIVVDVEDPNGIVWKYFPTGEGQLGSMTDPLGNTTQFLYNGNGDLTRITDPLGQQTRFSWDSQGNLTRITDPLDNQLDLTYDADDNLTGLLDPLGNAYAYAYDSDGNLEQITDPEGGVTLFDHDGLGQLGTITDARGHITTFAYDGDGNLTSMTTPLGHQTLYAYDGIGRPTGATTPSGVTRTYDWDGIDRLLKITYPDSSVVDFVYDCCQLQSVSGPNGDLSFTYDGAGRPLTYTDVWGNTIGYGLDPAGRLTSLVYPDGETVTYGYDDANRLTHVTDWLLDTTAYGYDALGRLIRTDLPNGAAALHRYDEASRLTALTNVGTDGSILSRYEYTHDALGNRTGVELYEPVAPSIPDETVTYQYDDDNRLLAASAATYEYDDDGNLITRTDGTGTTSYSYDFEGRLVEVNADGAVTSYGYDDLGTRVGRTVEGVETRYAVHPLTRFSLLLAEGDAAGSTSRSYVYGLGLSSQVSAAGDTYQYHFDGLGNVTGTTAPDGGRIGSYGYRPFGALFSGSGSQVADRFQFGGRFGVEREQRLLAMRARFYEPGTGRFTTRDPIGLASGLNAYTYARNNPINLADPSGEFAWLIVVAGSALQAYAAWKVGTEYSELALKLISNAGNPDFNAQRALRRGGARIISGGALPPWLGPFLDDEVDRRLGTGAHPELCPGDGRRLRRH